MVSGGSTPLIFDLKADAIAAGSRISDLVRDYATSSFGSVVWLALDLSRFHAAPSIRLGHLAFESHGAFHAEG